MRKRSRAARPLAPARGFPPTPSRTEIWFSVGPRQRPASDLESGMDRAQKAEFDRDPEGRLRRRRRGGRDPLHGSHGRPDVRSAWPPAQGRRGLQGGEEPPGPEGAERRAARASPRSSRARSPSPMRPTRSPPPRSPPSTPRTTRSSSWSAASWATTVLDAKARRRARQAALARPAARQAHRPPPGPRHPHRRRPPGAGRPARPRLRRLRRQGRRLIVTSATPLSLKGTLIHGQTRKARRRPLLPHRAGSRRALQAAGRKVGRLRRRAGGHGRRAGAPPPPRRPKPPRSRPSSPSC